MSPYLSKFVISDAHVDLFILTFTLKFIPSFFFFYVGQGYSQEITEEKATTCKS